MKEDLVEIHDYNMYFVNQRGCHFLSGSVLFGDPMFGKAANQSVHIPNIRNGYWCAKARFVNDTNKDGKSRIVLRLREENGSSCEPGTC